MPRKFYLSTPLFSGGITGVARGIAAFFWSVPLLIQIVIGFLVFFVALFLVHFLVRGLWIGGRLRSLASKLKKVARAEKNDPAPLFKSDRIWSHLWKEYADTLHEQRVFDPTSGEYQNSIRRSTVPASLVFTPEILVDSRLGTEFYKHLPGILTGIGIIGTFSGLVRGLQAFNVSEDAAVVRGSLQALLQGVHTAFIVSAGAIAAAMAITVVEKLLVTALYKQVEKITFELDAMFQSGAGEEYLARLVKASEASANESRQLKDALVSELERILTGLTEQQIAAQTSGSKALADQFADSVTNGLKEPLDRIANAFQTTTQGNSDAVTGILTDVLSGFSQKLEELFGGQVAGINQLQQQTIQALQSAVTKLDQVASGFEAAGTRTSEAMGARLTDAITAMESRQSRMNEQMTTFVEQLHELVGKSQNETNDRLQATLNEIGEAARLQIATLREQGEQASATHAAREKEVSAQTQNMLSQLTSQVESAVIALRGQAEQSVAAQGEREQRMEAHAGEATAKLAALTERLMAGVHAVAGEIGSAIEAMRGVTSDAVTRMNAGAETMYLAADQFGKAGQEVNNVLQGAREVADRLASAAADVSTSAGSLREVAAGHAAARDGLTAMVAELRATIEVAKRDASLSTDMLARIEVASQKLGDAQRDVSEYLDGISEVLNKAQETFETNLTNAVRNTSHPILAYFEHAVRSLGDSVKELGDLYESKVS